MLATTATLSGDLSGFTQIPVTFLRPDGSVGFSRTAYVGQLGWSAMTGDAAAAGVPAAFKSFCIDGLQSVAPGTNSFAEVRPLAASSLLGATRAGLLADFWRQYGPADAAGFADKTDSAAFQLAVWEIINDGLPVGTRLASDLATGQFSVAAAGRTMPAALRAAQWLAGFDTTAPGKTAVALHALQSPTRQDQVVCVPIVDLDVDSDNDGTVMRSVLEEREEDAGVANGSTSPTKPGLIVPVGGSRAQMIVEVPAGRTATLAIPQGAERVRVYAPNDPTPLAFPLSVSAPAGTRSTTLTSWIEAVAPSASMADIVFTLTTTGSGPVSSDTVRATAVAVDLDVDSNNDSTIDPDNGSAGTDDRIENEPETPGVRLPAKGQRTEMRLAAHATQPTASRLQIDSGAGNVELWDAPTGGTRLMLDAADGIRWAAGQRPAAVWIQAVRPSDEVGDIRFTLTESFGASGNLITLSDAVRATAMAEVILFFHFDTQTALDDLEDSLPPPTAVDQTGMLVLTPADSAALQARRAAWLAGHLATPTVAGTVKSFAELQNAVTAAEAKLTSARAAAAAMTSMRRQPSQHTSQQYLSAVESALYAHDEYLHAVQVAQKVQANFLADQSWISSRDEALLQRFFALPVRIDGLEADITPEQWRGLTDSFDGVRASLDRLDDNLGRAAGGLRATRDVLAGGVIAVGAVYVLPVSVAVYAGGTILAGGAILSGAKRWDAGQSEFEVVFGAAADTAGVTSFSLGLWGTDPVTGQEVALTPEDGTYELIVGASSISMLVGMPFANGLRGPTTRIPMPKPQVQFVESFSVVGDTVVASPVPVPVVTWTKGAIEVSHQGVAIGSAYAGTTRIVAMMASGPGNNPNLVGSAAQAELRDVGTLQGKTRAEIENMLQQRGYTAVPNRANDGGKVWTKSFADGSTAVVRTDPGNINLPQGYAGRVAHAHKEIVPSANVVNGDYRGRATKLDDLGNPSTIHSATHIPIAW